MKVLQGVTIALAFSVAISVPAGCSGTDQAVSQGGTFEFVSPGGQTEIHYEPPADRGRITGLQGPSVLDPDTTIALEDFKGDVVVVNLWGQWCGPCRAESDDLQSVHEQFVDEGATVLGINLLDRNRKKPSDFIKDNGISYPSIWDPSQAAVGALRGFPTSVIPSTLVLDRQHRVAAVFLAEVTEQQLVETVQSVLAEDPA